MSIKNLKNIFEESINVKRNVLNGDQLLVLEKMSEISAQAIMNGNKLMLCGNGGSAADAQHLAAEMLVRLRPDVDRESPACRALSPRLKDRSLQTSRL